MLGDGRVPLHMLYIQKIKMGWIVALFFKTLLSVHETSSSSCMHKPGMTAHDWKPP